jgi:hypothetical protein
MDAATEKTGGVQGSDPARPEAREPEQPAQTDGQEETRGGRWTSSVPQVASEDVVAIGNGRYAHFRRDRRFAQVQVAFTAPQGVDPDPGRELIGQFKELGWTWRRNEPGKPWTYQLDRSSKDDLTARGDSWDALHEQFLIIIQEYRQKHRMPPTIGWGSPAESETKAGNADGSGRSGRAASDPAAGIGEEQKPPSAEEEARAGRAAEAMLEAFAGVGAERFDLTFTDAGGGKVGFRGNRPLGELRSALPAILREAAGRRHNVIVRPRSSGPSLVQLDDLGEAAAGRLGPVSFLIQRTSPGNYQAWLAVADGDAGFARRLRQGMGADLAASGATRVSGSLNFKEKYAPAFPRVETVHTGPGAVVTRAELEEFGVVAPPEKTAPPAVRPLRRPLEPRGWPSYQRCVDQAPAAREGGRPDISRADFTFCLLAIDWGWSVEETAGRLMQESGKAWEEGEKYAMRTARAAARAIAGRGR